MEAGWFDQGLAVTVGAQLSAGRHVISVHYMRLPDSKVQQRTVVSGDVVHLSRNVTTVSCSSSQPENPALTSVHVVLQCCHLSAGS
jgi:hypothetical protein